MPPSPNLISIILVSYYTGDALFSCISSVLSQNSNLELIVVNNGNPDGALQMLHTLKKDDPRVSIISGHGNIGFGSANNLGVRAATGQYLLLLNPDCLLRTDTLPLLMQEIQNLPPISMIGARILNEDGTDQRGCRRELLTPISSLVEALHLGRFFPAQRLNRHEAPIPAKTTPVPAISGAFMFLSRQNYELIGGFDEDYFLHVEDLDICLRFNRAGGTIYFAPHIIVTHIGSTSDATSDFIEHNKARGFSTYFHKNFGQTSKILLWALDIAIWARYFLRRTLR